MFDVVLIKEISKVYENIYRMSIVELKNFFEKEKKIRGEFVLVIPSPINQFPLQSTSAILTG